MEIMQTKETCRDVSMMMEIKTEVIKMEQLAMAKDGPNQVKKCFRKKKTLKLPGIFRKFRPRSPNAEKDVHGA